MNQRADSLKKNLQLIGVKPLINRRRWLLSHIMRCNRGENRIEMRFEGVPARLLRLDAPSTCARSSRACAPGAFAGSGPPARTKAVRAGASRFQAPAENCKNLRHSAESRPEFRRSR